MAPRGPFFEKRHESSIHSAFSGSNIESAHAEHEQQHEKHAEEDSKTSIQNNVENTT